MSIQAIPAGRATRMDQIRKLWPLGPIFTKEMRQMARRKRSYALRILYLGLLLSLLGMTWLILSATYRYQSSSIVTVAQRQAEMGQVFFSVFSLFSVAAMHLIGPVLTSTAIGSERLRRTFDVLLMTPISAWQLVGGKLFSRLLSAVILLGLTLPVLSIVRLLGGVELENMFGVLTLAMSTAMSAAAIGLLLSCWITRAWAVIVLSYLIQAFLYGFVPMITMFVLFNAMSGQQSAMMTIVSWIAASNPLFTTGMNLENNARMFGVSWWTASLVQVVFAMALTLIAANVVRRIGRRVSGAGAVTLPGAITLPAAPPVSVLPTNPSPAETAQPPSLPSALPLAYAPAPVARPKERTIGDHPVLWREIRRPLFPRRWQRVTAVAVTLVLLLISYAALATDSRALGDNDTQIAYAFVMHTLMLLMAVVLSATAIAGEKESDTWTLLIVSPVSGHAILWGKFLGILRRLFWPWMLMVAHFGLFTATGVLSITSFLIILWVATFNLVWIASGIYLSLRVKQVTAAVVLNLLLPVAVYAFIPLALTAIETSTEALSDTDLAEAVFYYLPYWHSGIAIERLARFDWSYALINLPMSDSRIGGIALVALTFIAGAVQILIAGAILLYTGIRFDRIVKRAT